MNKDAAQLAVEHYPAVFLNAALLPEKVQDTWPNLWCQTLIEVVFGGHEVEQPFPGLAAWVEAVGDVEVVGDRQLFAVEAEALGTGENLIRRAIVSDGTHTQLILVGLPQGVPAAVS